MNFWPGLLKDSVGQAQCLHPDRVQRVRINGPQWMGCSNRCRLLWKNSEVVRSSLLNRGAKPPILIQNETIFKIYAKCIQPMQWFKHHIENAVSEITWHFHALSLLTESRILKILLQSLRMDHASFLPPHLIHFGTVSCVGHLHGGGSLRDRALIFTVSPRVIFRAAGHSLLARGWWSTGCCFPLQNGFFSIAFVPLKKMNTEVKHL